MHTNSCRGGVEHPQRDLEREAIRQANRHRQMGLARPGQHFERLPVRRMNRVVHRHRQALQAVLHRIITRSMKLLTCQGVLVEEEGSTYMADNSRRTRRE